jgi:Protein of unknown function (DUF2971)
VLININDRPFDSNIVKYSPINKYTKESIAKSYLWFSDPAQFNDPYDLNLRILLPKYTKKDFVEFGKVLVQRGINKGNTAEQLADHFMSDPDAFLKQMQGYADTVASGVGVSCFSETEYNLLMWSHYADKHSGLCFKFDAHDDQTFFSFPIKVEYPEEYPIFDYFNFRKYQFAIVQFLVGIKSVDWKYEREIRIVKNKTQNSVFRGEISFDKKSLKEIIFGYRTSTEEIHEIKSIAQEQRYICTFFKMSLKKKGFGLVKEAV